MPIAKVNNIDASGFVLKNKYEADAELNLNLEKKFLILVGKNRSYTKISEIESKIPSISGLATTSALTAAGNKIPDFSGFVKNRLAKGKN